MTQKIRWGVLGWARIARLNVIPAIARSRNGRLQAVASRSEAKRAECRAQCHPPSLHTRYEDLLRDPEVDAVYIPLPNSLHREWTIRAAEQGKHVLCEKPAALNAAEAREMIAACHANGVVFMEAFMYRYTTRTQEVLNVLRQGRLGEIRFISAQFRFFLNRPGDVRREAGLGGGSLYDVGCYPVNFIGMAMDAITGSAPGTGPQPVDVSVQASQVNGVDEQFSALLRYPGGVTAALHSGFDAHFRMGAEIIGTKGVLEVPFTFLGNAGPLVVQAGEVRREIPIAESDRYQLQAEDFADAILQRRPPLLGGTETLRNLEILDRLHAAAGRSTTPTP